MYDLNEINRIAEEHGAKVQMGPHEYEMATIVSVQLGDQVAEAMDSDLFISRSRKRIADLTPEDCCDGEYFSYRGCQIWNGF